MNTPNRGTGTQASDIAVLKREMERVEEHMRASDQRIEEVKRECERRIAQMEKERDKALIWGISALGTALMGIAVWVANYVAAHMGK